MSTRRRRWASYPASSLLSLGPMVGSLARPWPGRSRTPLWHAQGGQPSPRRRGLGPPGAVTQGLPKTISQGWSVIDADARWGTSVPAAGVRRPLIMGPRLG